MFRKHSERQHKSPVDILIDLDPTLVDDLAGLAGGTVAELWLAFQVMPWADRVALAGHGVIDLDRRDGFQGRVRSVHPVARDLVQAAFERYEFPEPRDARSNFGSDDGDGGLRAEEAVPKVDVVQHLQGVARQVPGKVVAVSHDGDLQTIVVQVKLTSDGAPNDGPTWSVEVAPWPRADVRVGDKVVLGYVDPRSALGNPTAMTIESKGAGLTVSRS